MSLHKSCMRLNPVKQNSETFDSKHVKNDIIQGIIQNHRAASRRTKKGDLDR